MKNKWSWIVGGILMAVLGLLIVWILNVISNGSAGNFPFGSVQETTLFLASLFVFGALMGLVYSNSAKKGELNQRSSTRAVDMSNFNISLRNLKYILPILALIIVPFLLRINFGLSRVGDFVVSILIAIILYKIPWFKVSNTEYQKVNEQRQKTFLLIFLPIIALLIALPVFYGPIVENFLVNTLHINPDTALDSIRAFFGIHLQQ
jgi:hypothetical protein